MNAPEDIVRCAVAISGAVQGVGMRPFVFRLARALTLTGTVRNAAGAVEIEVQSGRSRIDEFVARLRNEAPPSAQVEAISVTRIERIDEEREFTVLASIARGDKRRVISSDLATCAECFAETERSSTSRRSAYAFTSCNHCGPPYSIAEIWHTIAQPLRCVLSRCARAAPPNIPIRRIVDSTRSRLPARGAAPK